MSGKSLESVLDGNMLREARPIDLSLNETEKV
jgi:hypothetical protein